MARPRKPSRLKVLEGTDRRDRANPGEPKPIDLAADTPAPQWLSSRGKEAWADLLPVLRGMGVITVADPTAFVLLCDALGEYIGARAWLNEHEDVYALVAKNGEYTWRKRPEVDIAQDAWRRAKTMLTEFGLTPAARSRVSGKSADKGDPLDKWMTG